LRRILNLYVTSVQLDNLTGDMKAQSHTGEVMPIVCLVKTVEDSLTLVRRYAYTLIGYREPYAPTVSTQFDPYRPTVGAELDGIVKQVGNHLLEPHRIDHCFELLRSIKVERVAGVVLLLSKCRLDKSNQVGCHRFDPQLSGFNLRGIEQARH
jgi:hypothetical protein